MKKINQSIQNELLDTNMQMAISNFQEKLIKETSSNLPNTFLGKEKKHCQFTI